MNHEDCNCVECQNEAAELQRDPEYRNDDGHETPDESQLVRDAIRYLQDVGCGRFADAVYAMWVRSESAKANWIHCDCGARRPPDAECPTCDHGAVMPCICREYVATGDQREAHLGVVTGALMNTERAAAWMDTPDGVGPLYGESLTTDALREELAERGSRYPGPVRALSVDRCIHVLVDE